MIFNRMVEYQLDTVFAALADPTRRAILARLARGDAPRVTELAAPMPMSLNAVSKHLRVLEEAGLVRRTVAGREHRLALDAVPLRTAADYVEQYRAFWEERLDALERFLLGRKRSSRARSRTRRRKGG
jgi:DNA-binding transcriptional ArsR family regulator